MSINKGVLYLVYFIADPIKNVVKIGFSKNPKRRLKQLQTSNSNMLILLGYLNGNKETEKFYHKLFGKYRLSGEWFHLDKDNVIVDYINNNNLLYCFVDRIDGKIYRLNKMKNF